MARIVCVFPGMTGILHCCLELARRLEEQGHEVYLGCPWDQREAVERNGFRYVQFEPIDFDPTPPAEHGPSDSKPTRVWRTLTTRGQRRARAVADIGRRRFVDVVRELEADLVLIDMELHEFILPAVARGIPVALLSQWYALTKRPGLPPLTSALVPRPHGSASGLAIEWEWTKERVRRWRARFPDQLRALFCDRRSVLLRFARQTGFPTSRMKSYSFLQPFVYTGLPVLSMTDPELDLPHPVEPGVRHVGAMVFGERTPRDDPETETALERIYAECGPDRPLIYCSVTTAGGGDTRFLERVKAVAERRPEWRFVLGLGGGLEPGRLGELPTNLSAFEWVPQLEVLARADLSINHGGINTIHECIHFRVPMVIYSGKHHDQNGCAVRMAYHGLALTGDKDLDTPGDIEASIRRVLEDPSFRTRIEQAHVRYTEARRDAVLGRVVTELLTASDTSTTTTEMPS